MPSSHFAARLRPFLCATAAAFSLSAIPTAQADVVLGRGSSPITKDTESVRALATRNAKRAAVRAMLINVIGRERMNEITPDQIEELADQISSRMIISNNAERLGNEFTISVEVEFERGEFTQQLSAFNIQSSSKRADNNRQLMAVYLDMSEEMASDFSQPAEVNFEYDSSKGSSYSDRSSMGASYKESSADSYRNASGSSSRAAGGSSGRYGSAAYSGANSRASSTSSASASSTSSSFAAQNNIQASEHDDVRIRHRVVYQTPPKSMDGDAITNALAGAMMDHEVQTSDVSQFLSMAFGRSIPRYKELKQDPRYNDFLTALRSNNTPFFMGGTFNITQEGRSTVDNQSICTGSLDADALESREGRRVASGMIAENASGSSPQDCRARLNVKLAKKAADTLGPQIQRYWRDNARANVGHNSQELANYSLTLRGQGLDMNMQQSLLDAVQDTQGANLVNFISASSSEMQISVSYQGTMPLHMSLFGNLRSKPGFANMQNKIDGRSILLCLSQC